jgi:hypothetical protein
MHLLRHDSQCTGMYLILNCFIQGHQFLPPSLKGVHVDTQRETHIYGVCALCYSIQSIFHKHSASRYTECCGRRKTAR